MGRHYTQLTLEDRCQMAYLHTTGHSIRQIAATLDRAPSTVARELNRNGSTTQGYQPSYADQQARARRWQGSKLDRDSTLRATVLAQSNTAGPPNRWPAASRGSSPDRSSPTRPSTASSMRRWPAKQSTPGATICRRPKPNAGAVQGAQPGVLYRSAPPAGGAAGGGRGSPYPGPLGGRSDVVPDLRPSHLDPP